jgi:nitroimidazol reductase NimA-like FMN-containing flavoprotein (pyridoxamine 5'-phosphate oxidase superfamily)
MRRREKEIQNQKLIEQLLRNAPVCRIGLAPDAAVEAENRRHADSPAAEHPHPGYPYVVPVHFVHAEGLIYIHSARKGRKIEMARENPRVCVEIDEFLELKTADKACDFATRFRSLIAFGRVRIVEEAAQKRRALQLLMEKYAGRSFDFPEREIEQVAIIEIRILDITGKES